MAPPPPRERGTFSGNAPPLFSGEPPPAPIPGPRACPRRGRWADCESPDQPCPRTPVPHLKNQRLKFPPFSSSALNMLSITHMRPMPPNPSDATPSLSPHRKVPPSVSLEHVFPSVRPPATPRGPGGRGPDGPPGRPGGGGPPRLHPPGGGARPGAPGLPLRCPPRRHPYLLRAPRCLLPSNTSLPFVVFLKVLSFPSPPIAERWGAEGRRGRCRRRRGGSPR